MTRRLHVLTNSEIEDFRKCRAYWGFRYPDGLRQKVVGESLGFGKLYHAGAAAGWRAAWQYPPEADPVIAPRVTRAIGAAIQTVREQTAQGVSELRAEAPENEEERSAEAFEAQTTAEWALQHYFETCSADLRKIPLAIEAGFRCKIPNAAGNGGMLIQDGVYDLILWDPVEGILSIEDHKTTGYGIETLSPRLPLDTQMSGYVRALRVLVDQQFPAGDFWRQTTWAAQVAASVEAPRIQKAREGVLQFNVVRRALPAAPSVNLLKLPAAMARLNTPIADLLRDQEADGIPRGPVSSALIDTTAAVYREALDRQVHERFQAVTDKQLARLAELDQRRDSYFAQQQFYRGPDELERWRKEMWVEARQIREAERDPSLRTRNPHACTSPSAPKCVYAAVCLDPESPVARAEFRAATSRHEEIAEAHGGQRTSGSTLIGPGPADPF
jgi:hypothetical protein